MAVITPHAPTVTRCPVCGGLECLCRPRFFAGQLLTEEDLNRLENYIVGKNKLHNRYLHGWGVVCGLEVSCHQCKGFVTVRSGYALSPCGDDIVLCDEQAVNVCELIQNCRQQQFECDSAFPAPPAICGREDEDWILYVCYDERPSRGIAPLLGNRTSSKCSCGGSSSCGCGGSSVGGCGCGAGAKTQVSPYRPVQSHVSVQCEPTVLCEGFKFQLKKVPAILTKRDRGEFLNRLAQCLKDFSQLKGSIDNLGDNPQPSQVELIKGTLIALANQHSIFDCRVLKGLANLSTVPLNEVKEALTVITFELFRECFCSAILPPCDPPAEDNCVPLATLTINCMDGCNVVKICNLENRRLLITMPALNYWLEGLIRALRTGDILTRLCCGEFEFQTPGLATTSSRPDPLQGLFAKAVKGGGTIEPRAAFQFLQALWQEMTEVLRH